MRIITQGHVPDLVYRGRCTKCRTEIECDKNELKYDPDPRESGNAYVECPTHRCGKWIWVSVYDKTRCE